ncbi:MAG: luxQ 10, partial [Planctomycetaceae bacterium]|nr:luxQ 10 [Planctomycetaceae bacterium]
DARGHELMITRPARAIAVHGDSVRLAQVISNLLANAAKYTDKPSQIWLSVEPKEDNVLIRVRDNGIGMTEEELARVFKLFEQADNSIARTRGGLGIGLTLVKRIVEMHGGSVTATSPGLTFGSEFVVSLAVSSEKPKNADRSLFGKGPRKSGQRILVVDDNVDAAQSVERLLRHWGHEVQTAFNGPDAIERARTYKPTIILLDIGMPGMSGYEVAKSLRSEPELEGVVIMALTGYGQAVDRRRSKEAGFNHHLTKPPDPGVLAGLIDSPETVSWQVDRN